jgi:hypothetical protein
MNKRNIIILIILVIVIICLSCLWVYRGTLFVNFLNNKEVDIYNETIDIAPIVNIDNSEKVAKLYKLIDNKINNQQYIKEISLNVVNKIESMIGVSENFLRNDIFC